MRRILHQRRLFVAVFSVLACVASLPQFTASSEEGVATLRPSAVNARRSLSIQAERQGEWQNQPQSLAAAGDLYTSCDRGSGATSFTAIAFWNFSDSNLLVDRGAGTLITTANPANVTFSSNLVANAELPEDLVGFSLAVLGGVNNANNGSHLDLQVSTVGFNNILVDWDIQRTATGFNSVAVQASLDGVTFFNITNFVPELEPVDGFHRVQFGTGFAVENNPLFTFRFILNGATSETGLIRFDNIRVAGTPNVPTPPLANDNFADAQVITGTSGTLTGSNVGATKEAGEPNHAGNIGGKSIWYRWQAPNSGVVSFDLIGSGFHELLAIYTGSSVDALTSITSDSYGVTFSAIAGTTYYIAVDGLNVPGDGFNGQSGSVIFNWESGTPTLKVFANGPFKVGWEGSPGASNQWITIVTHINRTQSAKTINWDPRHSNNLLFNDILVPLHLRRSDGVENTTVFGFDGISPNKNTTKTFFFDGGLTVGTIHLSTTATWSERYNRYLSDIETQVTIQKLDSQGHVLASFASAPSDTNAGSSAADNSFITYAEIHGSVKTGISMVNNEATPATVTLNIYDLFDFTHTTPYATRTISIAPGQGVSAALDILFPNLPTNDGGGGKITDGNLDVNSDQKLTVTAFRLDENTLTTNLPVFLGRATDLLLAPVLVLEEGTNLAAALDAQTLVRDPFPIRTTTPWFGGDGQTRILLFADNIQLQNGEGVSAIQVLARDSNNNFHVLTSEDIRPLPNFPSRSQIMVSLPTGLPIGTLEITISLHGYVSNTGNIRIR